MRCYGRGKRCFPELPMLTILVVRIHRSPRPSAEAAEPVAPGLLAVQSLLFSRQAVSFSSQHHPTRAGLQLRLRVRMITMMSGQFSLLSENAEDACATCGGTVVIGAVVGAVFTATGAVGVTGLIWAGLVCALLALAASPRLPPLSGPLRVASGRHGSSSRYLSQSLQFRSRRSSGR